MTDREVQRVEVALGDREPPAFTGSDLTPHDTT